MEQDCLLNSLSLSNQLIEAAQAHHWELVNMLHKKWRREVSACTQSLIRQREQAPDQTLQAIKRLHDDVTEKIKMLEKIISQLQFVQQKELQKLNQTKAYLK